MKIMMTTSIITATSFILAIRLIISKGAKTDIKAITAIKNYIIINVTKTTLLENNDNLKYYESNKGHNCYRSYDINLRYNSYKSYNSFKILLVLKFLEIDIPISQSLYIYIFLS